MRQGKWCLATVGVLAVTLLSSSAWGGGVERDSLRANNGSGSADTAGNSGTGGVPEILPSMPTPAGGFTEPIAADNAIIVWDNNFGTDFAGTSRAAQCQSFVCDGTQDPIGILADNIELPAGTLVNGFKYRIVLSAAVPSIDGTLVQFWPDDTPCPGEPPLAGGTYTVTDFDTVGANTAAMTITGRFDTGEFWEAPGGRFWVSMSPVLPFPPQTFQRMVSTTIGPQATQGFLPSDPQNPWSTGATPCVTGNETDAGDIEFQLFGFPARGGTEVVTIKGGPATGGCVIRLSVNSGAAPDCGLACPNTAPNTAGNCRGSYLTVGGETPTAIATAIAADFTANGVCDGGYVVSMTAVGPRVIINVDTGAVPRICLGGSGPGVGLIGGPEECNPGPNCALTFQVGPITGVDVPAAIGADTDNLTTIKDCASTTYPNGTWQDVSYPAGFFDYPGLNQSMAVSTRMSLSGVALTAPADGTVVDDSDTAVARLQDVVLGLCDGDFSNDAAGASTTYNPDGLVNAADTASYTLCAGMAFGTGDCERFDADNDGDLDAADLGTMTCLAAANNSTDCCPGSNILPLSGNTPIRLDRLHLRSCDYLSVPRVSQTGWPEYWWCDYYISNEPALIRSGALGPCEVGDSELNDVRATADPIDPPATTFVGRGNPKRVSGAISDNTCNTFGCITGNTDIDVYSFTIAFDDRVAINVRGREQGPGSCTAGTMAVTSLWLYDSAGNLIANNDPPLPTTPWDGLSVFTDPAISAELAAGQYYVAVGAGGQVTTPNITALACSVGNCPFDDQENETGAYELNVAVAELSSMTVTKTVATGGTFSSSLLVQPLITYQKVGDPFHSIMSDTGEADQDATRLYSSGSSWTNNSTVPGLLPGDPNFVPGVSANGSTVVPIREYNNQSVPSASTILHSVEPPKAPKCDIPDTNCVYTQKPDDRATAVGSSRIFDEDDVTVLGDFSAADDFTLGSNTTIRSVQFWGTPRGGTGHTFEVNFWSDGNGNPGNNCPNAPENLLATYTDLVASQDADALLNTRRLTLNIDPPFVATGGTRYWVEIIQILGTSQIFWEQSADGNDVYFQDVAAEANFEGDNCPSVTGAALIGNGWDCTPGVDNGGTPDCDEGADTNGDQEEGDLAFCLSDSPAAQFTKLLPWDIACGNWRTMAGSIAWHQNWGPVGGIIGIASDRDTAASGEGGQARADDFTFFVNTSITDIHWYGTYSWNAPDALDRYSIEIRDDDNGLPGNLIQSYGSAVTPINDAQIGQAQGGITGNPGRTRYHYWYVLPAPFAAAANTTYWMSIINDTTGTTNAYTWFWATSSGGDINSVAAQSDLDALGVPEGWSLQPEDHAFDLTVTGSEKIITTMSISDPMYAPPHVATGLGYRLDSDYLHINGYEFGDGPNGSFDGDLTRFTRVRGPWKFFSDLPVSIPVASLDPSDFPGPMPPSAADVDALKRNIVGKTAVGLIDGLAAYDISDARNGEGNGGTLDRLCNGAIYEFVASGDALQERFWVKGVCWDNGVATVILHPHPAPECFDETECTGADFICNLPACVDGNCELEPNVYGDVNHDGVVDVFDILCVLDAFSGNFVSCDQASTNLQPCPPDPTPVWDVFDILAVLDGFTGNDLCCSPTPSAPARGAELTAGSDRGSAATIKLVPSSRVANAGDVVSVDVYVSGVTDLRGYQFTTAVNGGRRGGLELVGASIADRRDFALSAVENVKAVDEASGRLAGAVYSGGVATTGSAYVGTFTYEVSSDAVGSFRVGLGGDVHLVTSNGELITINRVTPATILVSSSARGL